MLSGEGFEPHPRVDLDNERAKTIRSHAREDMAKKGRDREELEDAITEVEAIIGNLKLRKDRGEIILDSEIFNKELELKQLNKRLDDLKMQKLRDAENRAVSSPLNKLKRFLRR